MARYLYVLVVLAMLPLAGHGQQVVETLIPGAIALGDDWEVECLDLQTEPACYLTSPQLPLEVTVEVMPPPSICPDVPEPVCPQPICPQPVCPDIPERKPLTVEEKEQLSRCVFARLVYPNAPRSPKCESLSDFLL